MPNTNERDALTVWNDEKQAALNDWFLSLPEGRQNAILSGGRWELAAAAFEAGRALAATAPNAGALLAEPETEYDRLKAQKDEILKRQEDGRITAVMALARRYAQQPANIWRTFVPHILGDFIELREFREVLATALAQQDGPPASCEGCKGSGSVEEWVANGNDRSGQSNYTHTIQCPECGGSGHGPDAVAPAQQAGAPTHSEQESAPCPRCGGSGDTTVMSDGGPDAEELTVNCPHCNGAQTLSAAYEGVTAMLSREEEKNREAGAIIWRWGTGLGGGGTAVTQIGAIADHLAKDGNNWAVDRLRALASLVPAGAPLPLAPDKREWAMHFLGTANLRTIEEAATSARGKWGGDRSLAKMLTPDVVVGMAMLARAALATPQQATLPASEAVALPVIREAFEHDWYDTYHSGSISARADGTYMHPAVDRAWDSWQRAWAAFSLATRAQPQADAAGESHPLNRHCGCTVCAPSFEQLVTALQLSAPKRIHLDVGEALVGAAPQQFKQLEEVTWSEDNATGHGIPYVRADLAAPQADAAEPVAKGATE